MSAAAPSAELRGQTGVVAAAVGAASTAIAAGREAEAAAQLDLLLPVGERLDKGSEAAKAEASRIRGAGRPEGAQNRSTRELREFLLARGADPHLEMARWMMLSPEELAERLRCTTLEAFDRLVTLWDKLAPYMRARLAPVDDAGRSVPSIAMFVGGAQVNAAGGALPPWARGFALVDSEAEENQALSEGAGAPSQLAQPQPTEKP